MALQLSTTFLAAAILGVAGTALVRWFALRRGIVDTPDQPRKIHDKPVPLLGGIALFVAVFGSVSLAASLGWLNDDRIDTSILIGSVLAGAVLVSVGWLDDRFDLAWWQQMLGPVAAIAIMLGAGLSIPFVSNPFGPGVLDLDTARLGGLMVPVGSALVFAWMLGMMYTTKLLDGIDGLATSISFVGATVLFVVSLFWDRSGSTTSFLALAVAGAALGFLVWNFHPAKIFLGEGGSTFLGFMLALLAIISGGKIATALLVMGVPILDVAWIIVRRLRAGQRLTEGDSTHLHFRLLHAGLSQRQIVALLSLLSLLFGSVSFFFETTAKVVALFVLVACMILITRYAEYRSRHSAL